MRLLALPMSCIAILSCAGGQNTREPAQSAGAASAVATTPAPNTPGTPTTAPDGGVPAPAAGNAAATAASGDAGPPANAPHTHDPGRGVDDINAIVKGHRDEARACYDKALADHPGIEGDLVITWTIDPKGAVTKTSLDMTRSTIAEPTVFACIADIIKRIQFAPSPGGFETKASYPFNFHPRHVKQSQ